MYRTFVVAKLVSHVLSESCEFNQATQDFSISYAGNEFTIKIDEETGEATTTTRPVTTSRPATTTMPGSTTTKYVDEDGEYYEEDNGEFDETRAAIIAKLDQWKNRAKQPCKTFKEKLNGGGTSKWTVCPFGGVGEVTDHGQDPDLKYTNEYAYWKGTTYCMTASYVDAPGHHLDSQFCVNNQEFVEGHCRGCEKLCQSGKRYSEDEGKEMSCTCCSNDDIDCSPSGEGNDDHDHDDDGMDMMDGEGYEGCSGYGKKVELTFVCQKSTRDIIKSVSRSDDGCTVDMEVRTNAAC
jgi:hypothetical protein